MLGRGFYPARPWPALFLALPYSGTPSSINAVMMIFTIRHSALSTIGTKRCQSGVYGEHADRTNGTGKRSSAQWYGSSPKLYRKFLMIHKLWIKKSNHFLVLFVFLLRYLLVNFFVCLKFTTFFLLILTLCIFKIAKQKNHSYSKTFVSSFPTT